MAQAYVGVIRWADGVPTVTDVERLRAEGGAALAELTSKVRALPANLPPTCKLVGAWSVNAGGIISFIVVEAAGWADLQAINAYYYGWLAIEWHPTQVVQRD